MKNFLIVMFIVMTAQAKIALVQYYPEFSKIEKNMNSLEILADEAVAKGAKIILFGEGAIGGYMKHNGRGILEVWCTKNRSTLRTAKCRDVTTITNEEVKDKILDKWISYSREKSVYLLLQIPYLDENQVYRNTAFGIGPKEGLMTVYHKSHLWWTDTGYAIAEKRGGVWKTPFGDYGLLICADGHFAPYLFEGYAKLGVDKYLALGYGIVGGYYARNASYYGMEGIFVDSQLYLGRTFKDGKVKVYNNEGKAGNTLFDWDLNFIGHYPSSKVNQDVNFEKRTIFYQL